MRTVQLIGVPAAGDPLPDADAMGVGLKSGTIPAAVAVAMSRAALERLKAAGARQHFFNYCSTFDPTDAGNIGPVADALLADLGETFTIVCPAFPENKRTVYLGHLFVGDVLLSDSSMRNHPLTPMTDANLVRVLGRQTRGKVGLVPYSIVRQGEDAIGQAFAELMRSGVTYAVVDAIEDADLMEIGSACEGMKLVTGGSGIAMGLPEFFRWEGWLTDATGAAQLPTIPGTAAVIAGSCSAATLAQIAHMKQARPAFAVDPLALAAGEDVVGQALAWASDRVTGGPALIYASAPPEEVARTQENLGRERAGELIERALAEIAAGL